MRMSSVRFRLSAPDEEGPSIRRGLLPFRAAQSEAVALGVGVGVAVVFAVALGEGVEEIAPPTFVTKLPKFGSSVEFQYWPLTTMVGVEARFAVGILTDD